MKVPRRNEMPHKLAMYSLLQKLLADVEIVSSIYFKGGSCAAMLGYLDRFSVDLDFDLLDKEKKSNLRQKIHQVIDSLGYEVKDEAKEQLQFFLKYRDAANERNTLKLEIGDLVSEANEYKKVYLVEIDKYCKAQTIETMFANKLVALKARYEEGKGIAGRDVYDVGHFFKQGYGINNKVVEDLRGVSMTKYIEELVEFVENEVGEKVLYQDLNPLLSKEKLNQAVPRLKEEVLIALRSLIVGS